jgi:hypothetical protein
MDWPSRQTLAGALGALALIVGGCATASAPSAVQPAPAPAPAAPSSNFAAPQDLFQRYPEMRRQTL